MPPILLVDRDQPPSCTRTQYRRLGKLAKRVIEPFVILFRRQAPGLKPGACGRDERTEHLGPIVKSGEVNVCASASHTGVHQTHQVDLSISHRLRKDLL